MARLEGRILHVHSDSTSRPSSAKSTHVSPHLCSDTVHGRVVKGVGHLGHDEAMEAGGREFSLHGRVVKGVGHLGHDEAMEAGGRSPTGAL